MNYQVFAVRTRPQSFFQVIGQEPIINALKHAIEKNKVHHAYLFTGTRGVGKTTIARIIAKALNCENLVDAEPCNICQHCVSISEGSFPDLIEIDAASRTKVEDTRALLDSVIYAPTHGKYKIYLIDEVHMLSTHSFNALLKTLEEPPSYVKFILATTELHKIPATILSRCLQFTLKWVEPKIITDHIINILHAEKIQYDLPALELISYSAQGSVRDALSLLEQAVAIGAGEVRLESVRLMLGRTPSAEIVEILDNVVKQNKESIIQKIYDLTMSGTDFIQFVTQLICALHQIAVYQVSKELGLALNTELTADLPRLAAAISPQDLQIYYQIALLAKRDLACSPSPKLAVEMALIRMLSFVPQKINEDIQTAALCTPVTTMSTEPSIASSGLASNPIMVNNTQINPELNSNTWPRWLNYLELKALSLQLVKNCEFIELTEDKLILNLDSRFNMLLTPQRQQEVELRVQAVLNKKIKLIINNSSNNVNTPAKIDQADQKKKHEDFVTKLQNDPNIDNITKVFNGELRLDLVELADS